MKWNFEKSDVWFSEMKTKNLMFDYWNEMKNLMFASVKGNGKKGCLF